MCREEVTGLVRAVEGSVDDGSVAALDVGGNPGHELAQPGVPLRNCRVEGVLGDEGGDREQEQLALDRATAAATSLSARSRV